MLKYNSKFYGIKQNEKVYATFLFGIPFSFCKEKGMEIKKIGTLRTDFPTKFGLPRQSGISENIKAKLIFEPEFRDESCIRGLDGFNYVWIIWGFSQCEGKYQKTVRPPRLGGNKRMGVFATRSPFRPNSLALSCLKLEKIENDKSVGPVLYLSGADMTDGTPVYDIKPYVPHADLRPDAIGGFADTIEEYKLNVEISDTLAAKLPESKIKELIDALSEDPRPSYIENDEREYGFFFDKFEIKFTVKEKNLTVTDVTNKKS